MAYADQQRWVTVQEKTFTKWYARRVLNRDDLAADSFFEGLTQRLLFET